MNAGTSPGCAIRGSHSRLFCALRCCLLLLQLCLLFNHLRSSALLHFSTRFCQFLYLYTSIVFVLHKWGNFLCVAHFGLAILVFSARFGAAFCCFNFAFCSSTYVHPLSHPSLLVFVTFVFFRLRCQLF